MCCSTVPSKDSKMFLSPEDKKIDFSVMKHKTVNTTLDLLLILAFSSSVRCSVLVLMTTFTLLTLKTWGNIPKHVLLRTDNPRSWPAQHWWELHRWKSLGTFASNPLMTSVFSVLQPHIPDLFLKRPNPHYRSLYTLHFFLGSFTLFAAECLNRPLWELHIIFVVASLPVSVMLLKQKSL